jgi:hypothetical protein
MFLFLKWSEGFHHLSYRQTLEIVLVLGTHLFGNEKRRQVKMCKHVDEIADVVGACKHDDFVLCRDGKNTQEGRQIRQPYSNHLHLVEVDRKELLAW